MNAQAISKLLVELPDEEQREVMDFIAFLRQRHGSMAAIPQKLGSVSKAPFIGMWKDREDMADSTAWVRRVREDQWCGHE